MSPEALTKAAQTADLLISDLREANREAIASGNNFAAIVLLGILADAAKLQGKIAEAYEAANP